MDGWSFGACRALRWLRLRTCSTDFVVFGGWRKDSWHLKLRFEDSYRHLLCHDATHCSTVVDSSLFRSHLASGASVGASLRQALDVLRAVAARTTLGCQLGWHSPVLQLCLTLASRVPMAGEVAIPRSRLDTEPRPQVVREL